MTYLFIDDSDTEKIMIDKVNFVEIPKEFTYELSEKLSNASKESPLEALIVCIKGWNFETKNGQLAEINIENLKKLPIKIIKFINDKIEEKIVLDKKK